MTFRDGLLGKNVRSTFTIYLHGLAFAAIVFIAEAIIFTVDSALTSAPFVAGFIVMLQFMFAVDNEGMAVFNRRRISSQTATACNMAAARLTRRAHTGMLKATLLYVTLRWFANSQPRKNEHNKTDA